MDFEKMPDFNVFDALGIPEPTAKLSYTEIRSFYKKAMLCVHPDRQFAPADVFPKDKQVGEAYSWLIDGDQQKVRTTCLAKAVSKYAPWGGQYTRNFFPELRREGDPDHSRVFSPTTVMPPAQNPFAYPDPTPQAQTPHNAWPGTQTWFSFNFDSSGQSAQTAYTAQGGSSFPPFNQAPSTGNGGFCPSGSTGWPSGGNNQGPGAHGWCSTESIFLGWPKSQMRRNVKYRQTVWGNLDGQGRLKLRIQLRKCNRRRVSTHHHDNYIGHGQVSYRAMFRRMTAAQIKAEIERLLDECNGNIHHI